MDRDEMEGMGSDELIGGNAEKAIVPVLLAGNVLGKRALKSRRLVFTLSICMHSGTNCTLHNDAFFSMQRQSVRELRDGDANMLTWKYMT